MFDSPASARFCVTGVILTGALIFLQTFRHSETTVPHQPLSELPYVLADWTGKEHPLQERTVQAVGVNDYTNRVYTEPADEPVQLYIGYYSSQKTADTIHSPKNCLPGAGWDPAHSALATISIEQGRRITVNEYVIQRDLDREMVFYWYQSGGRVIASEYSAKFWMIAYALSRNRTDGALVRIITPITESEPKARARLIRFTELLFPHLHGILPD
jgi:EpsI family protein